ncbi:response regulator [Mariprofundus erugo]|uniref:Response regulator n=1 Tax=Mariprofundus erugo TaxID=2528639 RepID=A0A5R9GUJ9_9PROT|nr:response regulator [Mariprofundus erugo]TLS67993.1 response regulator [Mariprofundus erugo]TLS74870.1 response regulator [Mariprofundus erugo]
MKALIVDDAKVVRVALGRIMNQLGYETVTAENGLEALEQMEAHPDTDVVMLDWNMPVMNGYDFLVAMREDSRFGNSPKVIMVTTETGMGSMMKALAAGADEYIMKPFDREMVSGKLMMIGLEVSDPGSE